MSKPCHPVELLALVAQASLIARHHFALSGVLRILGMGAAASEQLHLAEDIAESAGFAAGELPLPALLDGHALALDFDRGVRHARAQLLLPLTSP